MGKVIPLMLMMLGAAGTALRAQSVPAPVSCLRTSISGAELQCESGLRSKGFEITPATPTEAVKDVVGFDNGVLGDGTISEALTVWGHSCSKIFACVASLSSSRRREPSEIPAELAGPGDRPAESVKPESVELVRNSPPLDLNRSIYYKNRLEFSLDGGWLPINIPFAFDVFLGDGYTMTPLRYTLVPIIASLRWQVNDVGGPWILRGNWDMEASGAVTVIPRGPETRYFAWIMGFRRNFVPRRSRFAPYFDGRLGLGNIDAKEPKGVVWAQGEDFTFTLNMGSGVRYNFNPRYSISAGLNYMHISNLYLSEPRYPNYGINVYGPMFGIDVRLGKPRHHGSE